MSETHQRPSSVEHQGRIPREMRPSPLYVYLCSGEIVMAGPAGGVLLTATHVEFSLAGSVIGRWERELVYACSLGQVVAPAPA